MNTHAAAAAAAETSIPRTTDDFVTVGSLHLPPRPDNVEPIPNNWVFDKIARHALCIWYEDSQLDCRTLGGQLATHLRSEFNLTLTDLGRAVHTMDRAGAHWQTLSPVQANEDTGAKKEYPLYFVKRIIDQVNGTDVSPQQVVH